VPPRARSHRDNPVWTFAVVQIRVRGNADRRTFLPPRNKRPLKTGTTHQLTALQTYTIIFCENFRVIPAITRFSTVKSALELRDLYRTKAFNLYRLAKYCCTFGVYKWARQLHTRADSTRCDSEKRTRDITCTRCRCRCESRLSRVNAGAIKRRLPLHGRARPRVLLCSRELKRARSPVAEA